MKNENTYMGWPNYATKAVVYNIPGLTVPTNFSDDPNISADALAELIRKYAYKKVRQSSPSKGLAQTFARAFLREVDFKHIAEWAIECAEDDRECEEACDLEWEDYGERV